MRILLTGGERNDITQIEPLLEGIRTGFVLADKGYDAQPAIDAAAASGAIPIIPAASPPPRAGPSMQRSIENATSSNASSARSNTSDGSLPDTTSSPETTGASCSLPPLSNGSAECQQNLGRAARATGPNGIRPSCDCGSAESRHPFGSEIAKLARSTGLHCAAGGTGTWARRPSSSLVSLRRF